MRLFLLLLSIIAITGCTAKIIGTPVTALNVNTVAGSKWTLTELVYNKKRLDIPKANIPFIEFKTSDNQIVGMAGCNRFFSTYSFLSNNKLKFGDVAGTKMACEQMDIENGLLSAFENATEIKVDGENKLIIIKDKEILATFKNK
jgi:heat shock protein HslJ